MSKHRKVSRRVMLNAAVAGILGAASFTAMSANAAEPKAAGLPSGELGLCVGANSCKGKSVCATPDGSNSCKGMNSCKGKGVVKMTRGECTKASKKAANKKVTFEAGWTGM